MMVMTEKANKDPKSIRGNENGSQRISNQNNMKLYSSNTENQKTMKEWFHHFGNTISNIEFYTHQTKFYMRLFCPLPPSSCIACFEDTCDVRDPAHSFRPSEGKSCATMMSWREGATIPEDFCSYRTAQN